MSNGIANATMVSVDRIFLDLVNPRHEPFDDQSQAIEYLCREERVFELARDIAENGLNPLELFALLKESKNSYIVAEGNRRMCAIMLLRDPELAPAKVRSKFQTLSENWTPIDKLFSVVLETRDEVTLWLDRIHAGFNEGKGRRSWNSIQKTRNNGTSKNTLALSLLELGVKKGFITEQETKGRLTTVENFSANPLVKDALGITKSDPIKISTTLPPEDFNLVFGKLMKDVAKKTITTRRQRGKVGYEKYANELRRIEGLSGDRVESHSVERAKQSGRSKKTPIKPTRRTKIVPVDEISIALADIPNFKLEKLYYSLVSLSTTDHTPLLSVGVWSFFETLTAADGRSGTDFFAYLSKSKLRSLGFVSNQKVLSEVVKRFAEFGNTTKHHAKSAAFNGEQLINDFETAKELIIELAKNAKPIK